MKFLVFSDIGKNVAEIATKLRDVGEVHSFTMKNQKETALKSGSKKLVSATRGELAGSRPVCLDYRWLSEERQVGLSGKKVKPRVYIALGISGQIQHIAGMRGSKIVVAVNKDKDAPIFQECDYGIVGDLFQIVPKIVENLKK